jgi:hypothetical protein
VAAALGVLQGRVTADVFGGKPTDQSEKKERRNVVLNKFLKQEIYIPSVEELLFFQQEMWALREDNETKPNSIQLYQ